jgi:hypothetical protein
MSEERRKRQQERLGEASAKGGWFRKLLTAVLVVAGFGGAYYLGQRKRVSRLDGFAQCIAGKGAKMYGLYWCTHCAEQKEMFGASFQFIPYIECGIKGSRNEEQSCMNVGVKNFPTWQFADGERREGPQPLQLLSEKTGCRLP